jgi:hypothetical protein
VTTSNTPAAPLANWWERPEYIAEQARKRAIRDRFGIGPQARTRHRQYVLQIINPLLEDGQTHKAIAAYLNAILCERFGRPQPWVASSIKQMLKDEAIAAHEAQAARERYARQPKGEAAAARILKADIYQPDFQHFHHYSKPETTP